MITGGMKTTPTASMSALTGLPPLHLFIQSQSLDNNYKFSTSDLKEVRELTDTQLDKVQSEYDKDGYCISDYMLSKYNFNSSFTVLIPNREEWQEQEINICEPNDIWFTDGSKMSEGTGSGIYHWNTNECFSFPLGYKASVYQAELYAIEICVRKCLEIETTNKNIFIYSDSQAVLKSLLKYKVGSKLLWNCMCLLNELSRDNKVQLVWVPGHSNISGNEKADELARKGSDTKFIGPEPFFGFSISEVKIGRTWLNDKLEDYWTHVPKLRHSKLFIKGFDIKFSKEFLALSKKQARILTMFLTGHGVFNKHLKRLGLVQDERCRKCGDIYETAEHLLCECVALTRTRNRIFGKPELEPIDFVNSTIKDTLKFVNNMNMNFVI